MYFEVCELEAFIVSSFEILLETARLCFHIPEMKTLLVASLSNINRSTWLPHQKHDQVMT